MMRMRSQSSIIGALWLLCLAATGCGDNQNFRTKSVGEPDISGAFRFATIPPGASAESVVRISNVGAGELQLANFASDLGADFEITWFPSSASRSDSQPGVVDGAVRFPSVVSIPPSESIQLVMVYTPTSDTAPTGQLSFSTNAASSELRDIVLPVSGQTRTGELVVTPEVIDFGRVVVGESESQSMVISNIGQVSVNIFAVEMNGSARFTFDHPNEDGNWDDPDGDGEPGLSPNTSFELVVHNAPDFPRPDYAELIISSDAINPDLAVNLQSNAASPCIKVVPELLDFGAAGIGQNRLSSVLIESCGGEALRIEGISFAQGEDVYSVDAETLALLPATLPAADLNNPDQVQPRLNVPVSFSPATDQAYPGTLEIQTNDPFNPVVSVDLFGRGVFNDCPVAVVTETEWNVHPLDVITLDGSESIDPDGPDERPVAYNWVVVERPEGSTAQVVERFEQMQRPANGGPPDVANTPMAKFFVDLAGTYVFDLQVVDNRGSRAPSASCPQPEARVTVTAVPEHDLHLQLVWDTPGDPNQSDLDGSDVDLHFTHPATDEWFGDAGIFDCYFSNVSPDWGMAGDDADNPSLDIDDTNGAGPENINMDNPQDTDSLDGPYRLGVHYFRASVDEFGGTEVWGPSIATVRVYIFGVLAHESSRQLEDTNDFWEPVTISWTEESQTVTVVDEVSQKIP